MDIFDKRYYKTTTILLKIVGLWPYQSKLFQWLSFFFWYSFTILTLTTMGMPLMEAVKKKIYYVVAENVGYGILIISNTCKFTALMFSGAQVRLLTKRIANDWQTITDNEERGILKRYSQIGFNISRAFRVYILLAGSVYAALPYFSYFLDLVSPLQNGTHPKYRILYFSYDLFDEKEHHVWSSLHANVLVAVQLLFLGAVDSMFMLSVQHICALFAITSYRLRNVSNKSTLIHQNLVRAINLHIESLSACIQLEDCFSLSFLIENNLTMLGLNLCVIHFIYLTDSIFFYIKSVSFLVGLVIHLFYVNYAGQQLIDNSTELFDAVYFNNWYTYPLKVQKMMCIIMTRALTPSELTAGKISNLSYFTFLKIMKTTASLFTVLVSVFKN